MDTPKSVDLSSLEVSTSTLWQLKCHKPSIFLNSSPGEPHPAPAKANSLDRLVHGGVGFHMLLPDRFRYLRPYDLGRACVNLGRGTPAVVRRVVYTEFLRGRMQARPGWPA